MVSGGIGAEDSAFTRPKIAARFTCWGEEPPVDEPVGEDLNANGADDADATELAATERGRSAAAREKEKGGSGDHRGGGHRRGGRH